MSRTTCEDRALNWVHAYSAGGLTLAILPLPVATSAALAAAEAHMIYWIAKIYGEELSVKDIGMVASGLGIAGMGLKLIALEACNFIPVAGWLVKGAIAGGAVQTIGRAIVTHYEQKYPGKIYTADGDVEASVKGR
jgi:uncharacterized protein (DUF697 family)